MVRKWIRLIGDRAAALALIALGAATLVLGWLGVSDEVLPARQLPYLISAGMGGLFLLGLGGLFWLSADLRDEWTRLGAIEAALAEVADSGLVDEAALERLHTPDPTAADAGAGMELTAQHAPTGPSLTAASASRVGR